MPGEAVDKRAAAREVIDILDEISSLLVGRPASPPPRALAPGMADLETIEYASG